MKITGSELNRNMHPSPSREGAFPSLYKEKEGEAYATAYMLYQNRRYQEAGYLFRLLTQAAPDQPKYWKGLGACLQLQKDYEGALDSYCCCAQANSSSCSDAALYTHTADCYLALKEMDKALTALEVAAAIAKKTKQRHILQHVAFMKKMWRLK